MDRVLAQPRRVALLVHLATARPTEFRRRDKVATLFWPERDAEHARNSLSKAMHFLRRELGADVVVSRGDEEVGIDPCLLRCDVADFEMDIAEGRLAAGLARYRGPFLDGFHISDAPEFDEWLERTRVRLARVASEAAWSLALDDRSNLASSERARLTHYALDLSDGSETDLRRAIRLLDRIGDRLGVLHLAARYEGRLQQEFGATLSSESKALIAAVRSRETQPARDSGGIASPLEAPTPTGGAGALAKPTSEPSADVTARAVVRPRRPLVTLGLAGAGALVLAALAYATRPSEPRDDHLMVIDGFSVTPPDTGLDVWREGLPVVLGAALDGAGRLRAVAAWHPGAKPARSDERQALPGLRLTGHIIPSGPDSLRVMAAVTDGGTGRLVGEVEVRAARDRFDQVIDSLVIGILRELSPSRSVTTSPRAGLSASSLPALKAYLRGEHFARVSNWDSALAWYERAIGMDSAFALAWYRAADAGQYLRSQREWGTYSLRARELVASLPRRESLLVTLKAQLGDVVRGFPGWEVPHRAASARAVATARLARELYPTDADVQYEVGNALAAVTGMQALQRDESIRAYERSIRLDSGYAPPYTRLALVYLAAGRDAEARAILARTVDRFRDQPHLRTAPGVVELMRPDLGDMARSAAMDSMSTDGLFFVWGILARWPDSAEAQVMLARAMAARPDARNPFIARPETRRGILAYSLAFRGRLAAASEHVSGARSRSRPLPLVLGRYGAIHDSIVAAAWQAAVDSGRIGAQGVYLAWLLDRRDTAALAAFATRGDQHVPRGDSVPVGLHYAGVARAYLALLRGDSLRALAGLLSADSLCAAGCADVRLEALRLLRALGRLAEAEAYMQREVRPWIFDWTDPIEVEWQLERGRVYGALGRREQATAAYRYVSSAWRSADPILRPKVDEARAYLARR